MSRDGQGTNKALTSFNGRPMVQHVIERLGPQVDAMMLNVNQEREAFEAFGLPIISDAVGGFAGPLAGLHAGLSSAEHPWVLTAPCDSPFMPLDLAARLMQAALQADAELAVVSTGGRAQPVFALVRRSLLDNLTEFLAEGGRKIDAWYAPLRVVEVNFDDSDAFRNINTPEDLARFSGQSEPRASS
jgi:molybdopterin-guanine dinucleotide biosynthesis protein A